MDCGGYKEEVVIEDEDNGFSLTRAETGAEGGYVFYTFTIDCGKRSCWARIWDWIRQLWK